MRQNLKNGPMVTHSLPMQTGISNQSIPLYDQHLPLAYIQPSSYFANLSIYPSHNTAYTPGHSSSGYVSSEGTNHEPWFMNNLNNYNMAYINN